MANAAKGLSNILILDGQLKTDLMKIAPKILMLTYDKNPEVADTMKELWSALIDAEKENQLITERWTDIYTEAFKGMEAKEPRKQSASCLLLSDLIGNRTWPELKLHFKDVFLLCLGFLEHEKDEVKIGAY